ncbi:glycosyltransferase family 2 protein [Hoeflea prorocentri]|uniref:Glycosyltransferase family 2 protein n=1 Tax=Hoeflea prorocentri TaxID=1922333 RepID=A0A9X3ULP4_9HYPH|nr:glycosyltransferase family 2 protein [Hoeflea prorocentri]MCY6383140.1 glycosyltransferase family 2 protein [Hoeflea prorocentri]MDA5400940.1 glycosyltransferase family 2 protein [Hoeflea prorocentri]
MKSSALKSERRNPLEKEEIGVLTAERPAISIVVPVFNEEDSVELLCGKIQAVMEKMSLPFEIIFVDDGSTDSSSEKLNALADNHDWVRCIGFRRNFGKAAALDAGFSVAQGDILVTMDADLQDDPEEIPNFVAKLGEGYDVVSGWKSIRHDPVDKTLPSKVFNGVVSRLSGVKLNDFNCGFKAYRAEALDGLSLYGELHRFIPVLLHWRGYRVGEIPVRHHARQFGQSKYGYSRLLKGALDFMGVMLNTRYATRPLHVFGGVGILFGLAGFGILSYLTLLWFAGLGPIGSRPLLFLGMLLIMSSFQFVTIGLLGEFIQRQGAGRERRYTIGSTRNLGEGGPDREQSPAKRLAAIARRMKDYEKDAVPGDVKIPNSKSA